MKQTIFSILGLLIAGSPVVADTNFKVDKTHSNVTFEVDHLMVSSVSGRFTDFDGAFKVDDKNRLTYVKGVVQADTVNTDDKKRDKHLRSDDFFHVEKFPTLEFEASNVGIKAGSTKKMKGKLTIHGVTKTVNFETEFRGQGKDMMGDVVAGFDASTTINRKDFGLNWNQAIEAGGVLVGNEVEIELSIQGMKTQEKKTEEK